nr:hypothetical protein [Tanacetum cinerariifolium]
MMASSVKLSVIEQPISPAPASGSIDQVFVDWNAIYDAHNEVACLMLGSMTPELHRQFENFSPYEMLQELKSMFEKQARVERVGLILNGLTSDFAGFVRNYKMHNKGKTIGEPHALLIEYKKGLPKKAATPQVMAIQGGRILKAYKKSLNTKGNGKGKGKRKDKPLAELIKKRSKLALPVLQIPVCYDDDDGWERSNSLKDNIISGLPPCSAITPSEPVLSTEEPDNSLSMGDELLDTIPVTKSDKFIKSSVENLIPIPSESEGIPEHMCVVPFHENSLPLDVSKDQFEDFSESNDEFSSIDDDSFSIDNIDYRDLPLDLGCLLREIAIDAIPLATKPSVMFDWKVINERRVSFYHIIRADGSLKRYTSMINLLKNIHRQDLETLWKLVKAKYGDTRPEEAYEEYFGVILK